ncbi:MAG: hypothetical protein U1F56_12515 [Rubrivivax sp.]
MDGPERWRLDAGDRAIARLDVPGHATRERDFEIDVQFVVRAGAGAHPEHGLRVLIDGQQQWQRRVRTAPGGEDSLEWRQRRRVPVGQPLRIQALTEVQHALRLRLTVQAVEA